MNKRKGIIMILDREDKIHDWILYDFARRKKLPMKTITASKRELSRMRYTSIVDRKELVYVQDDDRNINKHIEDLKKVNTTRRVLAISAQNKELVKRLSKVFRNERMVLYPDLRDYEKRREQVVKVLQRWGVECRTQEVERSLIRSMVRDVTTWEDVKLVWEVHEYRELVFDEDILDELFPDDEFHNLDRFIFGLLKGSWKKKGVKTGHYFLEVREYSASWLISRIQEMFLDMGLFYQAYRGGVLIIPESPGRIKERVNGLEWENGLRLTEFSEIDQEKYLDIVKEMPYGHYVAITKHVMSLNERSTKEDVYEMIENIKKVRGGRDDDWGVQEFRYKKR